jgi:hypothetical protein
VSHSAQFDREMTRIEIRNRGPNPAASPLPDTPNRRLTRAHKLRHQTLREPREGGLLGLYFATRARRNVFPAPPTGPLYFQLPPQPRPVRPRWEGGTVINFSGSDSLVTLAWIHAPSSERFCSVSTGQISVCRKSSTISIRRWVTESSVMLPPENQGAAYARTQPRHLRHSGHLLYASLPTLHDGNENSGRDTCRCGSWRSDIRVPKMPLRSYVGLQTI